MGKYVKCCTIQKNVILEEMMMLEMKLGEMMQGEMMLELCIKNRACLADMPYLLEEI